MITFQTVWHLIQWLHFVALCLWVGGIASLILVGAPAAHSSMASKAIAGEIVGKMLKRLNSIELGCFFLLLGTIFSSFQFVSAASLKPWVLMAMILMMGFLTFFYTYSITPRLESLKAQNPVWDVLPEGDLAKTSFRHLHKLYVQLMSLNLLLGLATLYVSVVALT